MTIEVVMLFFRQKKKCENFITNWNRIFSNMMQKKCRGVLMIKCRWHTRHLLFVFTYVQTPFHSFKTTKNALLSTKTMCAFSTKFALRTWWYTETSCGCKERSDGIASLRASMRGYTLIYLQNYAIIKPRKAVLWWKNSLLPRTISVETSLPR